MGQKAQLKPKEIWTIRINPQNDHQVRDLALFNLAIGNKLRGCDLVNIRVNDLMHGGKSWPVQWSFSERPNVQCSSN